MKLFYLFSSVAMLLFSCQNKGIEAPNNRIDEEKMIAIIYDFSVLEGIKARDYENKNTLNPREYIYKKYKIDSLQFAQNVQYYASDIPRYKAMYEKVGKKLAIKTALVDSLIKTKAVKLPTK